MMMLILTKETMVMLQEYLNTTEFYSMLKLVVVVKMTPTYIEVIRTILIDDVLVIKTSKRSQDENDDKLLDRPFNSSSSVWTLSVALSFFSSILLQ